MVYVIWRGKHFWRRHRTTYIKLDKKSANIQSLIHPVVLLICSCHILEKQHKKIKKSRKSGILYVRLCSGCKGLQVSNMPRPKLDSRRDSEISCKNIRQFRMQYAPGWGGSIQIVDITETSVLKVFCPLRDVDTYSPSVLFDLRHLRWYEGVRGMFPEMDK